MYICSDCGCTFDEPNCRVDKEVHTELDDRPIEYLCYPICPECGGEDYTDADYCDYCNEAYSLDDLVDGTLCRKCLKEIVRDRSDLIVAFFDCSDAQEALAGFLHEHTELF